MLEQEWKEALAVHVVVEALRHPKVQEVMDFDRRQCSLVSTDEREPRPSHREHGELRGGLGEEVPRWTST